AQDRTLPPRQRPPIEVDGDLVQARWPARVASRNPARLDVSLAEQRGGGFRLVEHPEPLDTRGRCPVSHDDMVVHSPSGRGLRTSPVPPSETESSMNPRRSVPPPLSRLRDCSQRIARLRGASGASPPHGRPAVPATSADALRSATAPAASTSVRP